MNKLFQYLWLIPALYVAYEFGGKLFEALADPTEFASIIAVIIPLAPVSRVLAYGIGIFDFLVAVALLVVPNLARTRQYAPYVFWWVILWPLVPSSLRYFGGVAEFEIVQVTTMIVAAAFAYGLYYKSNVSHV